ncbi:MAG: hypothetical protein ABI904_18225 [Chloroflexota bacterium]
MDMKTRVLPTLVLLAVLLAACAPAAGTQAPAQSVAPVVVIEPSATPMPSTGSSATEAPQVAEAPTVLAIATSRGPNLEATDPSTVNLASGGVQLVEFFRFT